MRMATFVDLSYLRQCDRELQVDHRRLAALMQRLAEKLISNGQQRQISMARNILVGSQPANVAAEDEHLLDSSTRFFSRLRSFPCFEVVVVPIDYHQYRFRRDDRQRSSNPHERNFTPVEKMVDTTLVVRMMELLHRGPSIDVAAVISGDQDMIPALISLRASGCEIFVAGVNIRQTMSLQFSHQSISCVDLMDYRDEIERTNELDPAIQERVDELLKNIQDSFSLLNDLSPSQLSNQVNLWACRARLLNEESGEENNESIQLIFGLLGQISREYQPGFVPALRRTYQADWQHQIDQFAHLCELESVPV